MWLELILFALEAFSGLYAPAIPPRNDKVEQRDTRPIPPTGEPEEWELVSDED